MKPLVIILLQFCICFVAVGQQYGSSRPANNRKYTPPPPAITPEENYNAAVNAYNNGYCHTADGYVRLIKKVPAIKNGQSLLALLKNNIKDCIQNKLELDEATGFNPAKDDLSPLSNDPGEQIGYEYVQYGNDAFNNKNYADALQFYLRYIDNNFTRFMRNKSLFNQFEEKIEYCLGKLDY